MLITHPFPNLILRKTPVLQKAKGPLFSITNTQKVYLYYVFLASFPSMFLGILHKFVFLTCSYSLQAHIPHRFVFLTGSYSLQVCIPYRYTFFTRLEHVIMNQSAHIGSLFKDRVRYTPSYSGAGQFSCMRCLNRSGINHNSLRIELCRKILF